MDTSVAVAAVSQIVVYLFGRTRRPGRDVIYQICVVLVRIGYFQAALRGHAQAVATGLIKCLGCVYLKLQQPLEGFPLVILNGLEDAAWVAPSVGGDGSWSNLISHIVDYQGRCVMH